MHSGATKCCHLYRPTDFVWKMKCVSINMGAWLTRNITHPHQHVVTSDSKDRSNKQKVVFVSYIISRLGLLITSKNWWGFFAAKHERKISSIQNHYQVWLFSGQFQIILSSSVNSEGTFFSSAFCQNLMSGLSSLN